MLDISERRACRYAGLSRSSYRESPTVDVASKDLSARIVELAYQRRRFGYRRIHDLLAREGHAVNHKRVWRLYKLNGLSVRKRRKAKRVSLERTPLSASRHVNDTWSADFVMDALANGRRIKCLTVVDDFSRECVDIALDYGMGGQYVARVLDQVGQFRGYPKAIRTDQGPEFTSRAFMAWAHARGVRHLINDAGKPTQNAYIESFDGKFRDECLRAVVRVAAPGSTGARTVATRLQRGAPAQRHRSDTAGTVRRVASPACRRCKATTGGRLASVTLDSLTGNWHAPRWQVTPASRRSTFP